MGRILGAFLLVGLLGFLMGQTSGKDITPIKRGPASDSDAVLTNNNTLTIPPTEKLHCEFQASGFPESSIDYDPSTATVDTTTGDPKTEQQFTSTTILSGLATYDTQGFAVVAFGDVPLFYVSINGVHGDFPATWGSAPGGPTGILNAGVCSVPPPPHHHDHDRGHHREDDDDR